TSGVSLTSTVLEPGGTSSSPSHPQVNTRRRGGSISTNSPTTVAPPAIPPTRYVPPGRGSSSAEVPFQRLIFSGSTKNSNTVSGRASMRTSSSPASGRRTCATSAPLLALGLILQRGQPLRPHLLDERTELLDALGPEAVDPLGAVAAFGHEAGLLQHGQVLADRGTRDLEGRGDLPGGTLPLADELQDLTAAWFGDRLEGGFHPSRVGPAYVSVNLRIGDREASRTCPAST